MRCFAERTPPLRQSATSLLLCALVALIVAFPSSNASAYTDIYWSQLFSVPPDGQGADGPDGAAVFGLEPYGDLLVATGDFSRIGDAQADCIAAWDGSHWQEVGSGFPGDDTPCTSRIPMAVYDGVLYVAWGDCRHHYISRWDQSVGAGGLWTEYAHEVDGTVRSMTVYEEGDDHYLILGGRFNSVDGVVAKHVARFDGQNWESMAGLGVGAACSKDSVAALVVHDGCLIAGGNITSTTGPGSAETGCLARWDASALVWVRLGEESTELFDKDHPVKCLASYDGRLYAAAHRRGVYVRREGGGDVASWERLLYFWQSDQPVVYPYSRYSVLSVFGDLLVVGGEWLQSEGCGRTLLVTKGSATSCLGNLSIDSSSTSVGAHPRVFAVAEYRGQLYVGGRFDLAGGSLASNIARWGEPKHACSISGSDIDFGTVQQGCGVVREVEVLNVSGHLSSVAPLDLVLDVSLGGAAEDFLIVAGEGHHVLSPGDDHVISVAFAPTSSGDKECDLVLGPDCSPVLLRGTCEDEQPICEIDGELPIDFGDVCLGSTSCGHFFLRNAGGGTLEGELAESCEEFDIVSGAGGFSLSHGEVLAVAVEFAPLSEGIKSCPVSIQGCQSVGAVELVGAGVPVGTSGCSVSPLSASMRARTFTHAQTTFTITNVGDATLQATARVECAYFQIARGTAGFTLEPGESHTIIVTFSPRFRGVYHCTLEFEPGISCPSAKITGLAY